MITDLIIDWFLGNVLWLLELLPVVSVPSWLTASQGFLDTVTEYANAMGAWLPTALLVQVQSAILAAWGVGFAIKGVRMIASYFTAGGGSAA